MQRVTITIENNKNAYLLLKLIKNFDFIHSINFENDSEDDENEIFIDNFNPDMYLDDFNLSVSELRKEILKDEKEQGMSKEDFFKSIEQWRNLIEK
ncbi:MAG: hypothetical protein DRJ10_19870 [Bacteroidetes bacterium]|nr:MAG: hypothetical protein DRJ10_19870 [Bacteroidota bacterium]